MYIKTFEIQNYKSFRASGEQHFSEGFNVIVGQNNAGKTALVEALGLVFYPDPHRSLATKPTPDTVLDEPVWVKATFELGKDELVDILGNQFPAFLVQVADKAEGAYQAEQFIERIRVAETLEIRVMSDGGSIIDASLSWWDTPYQRFRNGRAMHLGIDREAGRLFYIGDQTTGHSELLVSRLAELLKSRVYRFKAERTIPDYSPFTDSPDLLPNANNLANALHDLQTRNTPRFARFNRLVQIVLPDVRQVMVPRDGSQLGIQVWSVDPDSERADLAIPLNQSGSGIGQVLAVLYLVVTSDHPRTIIIDEPQSYLHPGAIRKLFDVLRTESVHQHQFIVTTHSPTVITAADPRTVLMVRKVEAESQIASIDVRQTQHLREALADVGVRLADVFGADNVLWVEGRTEEECFPRILRHVAGRPLLGTSVVGLVNTGDLEGRHADTVVNIYQRLSGGGGYSHPQSDLSLIGRIERLGNVRTLRGTFADKCIFFPAKCSRTIYSTLRQLLP